MKRREIVLAINMLCHIFPSKKGVRAVLVSGRDTGSAWDEHDQRKTNPRPGMTERRLMETSTNVLRLGRVVIRASWKQQFFRRKDSKLLSLTTDCL